MTRLERELEASVAYFSESERQMSNGAIELHHSGPGIARTDERSSWEAMRAQAKTLVDSGFLPRAINTPEKAMAVIQTGRELGLQPMQAIRSIHIIEGKPTMSADLIAGLSLAWHPGGTLRVSESTNDRCVVLAARAGQEPTKFEFSLQDANRAGLTGKDVWKRYPRAMLRARCLTEAARAIFPDVVAGIYDPEELDGRPELPPQTYEPAARQTPAISPHGVDADLSEQERAALVDPQELMGMLVEAQTLLAAGHWAKARAIIGAKGGERGDFGEPFSAAKNSGKLSADYSKALGRLWGQLDRQIAKLEKADLEKPADVLSTLTDDDSDDFQRE